MTSVVFSGHMIDASDRSVPRFPPDDVPIVAQRVRQAVASVTDPGAQAFSGVACGGDLIFCEAWLESGRPLTVFLPREVEGFLNQSVAFAGPAWVERFRAVTQHPSTTMVEPEPWMTDVEDPHTPNNLRMLQSAWGAPPVVGIFVWDGGGGEGPGGTGDLVAAVRDAGCAVTVIAP